MVPGSLDSLKAYLGSGAIPGVGPKTAALLVKHLGEHVLEKLDGNSLDELVKSKKIGKATAMKIKRGWEDGRGG